MQHNTPSSIVWSESPWSPSEIPSVVTKPPTRDITKKTIATTIAFESPAANAPQAAQKEWPMVWDKGWGVFVQDLDGNRYLDCTSGFAVTNTGHCHPKVVEAIQKEASELLYCRSQAPHRLRALLLEKLHSIAPGDLEKTQLAIGGAEAIQIAIKLARFYKKAPQIVAFHGAFHGKTGEALAVTSDRSYRAGYLEHTSAVVHVPYPYCYRCPFGLEYPGCETTCLTYLRNLLSDPASGLDAPAAIILEPIEGAEGIVVPPDEFVPELRNLCNRHDILLISDEIQTGFGRTGKLFCFEHWAVSPDIMAMGKGISGGVPMAAVIAKAQIMDAWAPGAQTSTFMGNPLGWAAALAAIDVYTEDGLVHHCAAMGSYLLERFRQMQNEIEWLGDVRGKGLLIGLELVRDRHSKEPYPELATKVDQMLLEHGIIADVIGRYRNVVPIRPPLPISQPQADFLVETLYEVLRTAVR